MSSSTSSSSYDAKDVLMMSAGSYLSMDSDGLAFEPQRMSSPVCYVDYDGSLEDVELSRLSDAYHISRSASFSYQATANTGSSGSSVVTRTFDPHESYPALDFLNSGSSTPLRRHSSPCLHQPAREKRFRAGSPTTLSVDTSFLGSTDCGLKQLEQGITMASLSSNPPSRRSSVMFDTPVLPVSSEDIVLMIKERSEDSLHSDAGSSYDSHEDDGGDDDEDGEYGALPPAPNTKIIDNKPRRGGRHKRDGKQRDELLPPPSPNTLNDPDLMQDYRQERNRLAAKRSRERKKDYIGKLEATCKALKNHNDDLARELLRVKKELNELKGKARRRSVTNL